MKENYYFLSRIEIISQQIISILVKKKQCAYDEVAVKFKSSMTYQFLKEESTEFYLKDIIEIYEIWEKEGEMDRFLEKYILPTNNTLLEISNQEIKNNLKRKAFLEGISIEDVYYDFTHPESKDSRIKKKLPTPN